MPETEIIELHPNSSKQKYNVSDVVRDLQEKNVRVDWDLFEIDISHAEQLGSKSLGKIDFLVNQHHLEVVGWDKYRSKFN